MSLLDCHTFGFTFRGAGSSDRVVRLARETVKQLIMNPCTQHGDIYCLIFQQSARCISLVPRPRFFFFVWPGYEATRCMYSVAAFCSVSARVM